MKIVKVDIEGYKSFKKATLTDLGKLVILIGRNGAGKSNLLELLEFFFRDLDALPQKALGNLNDHYWHSFDVSGPIRVSIEIELDGESVAHLLPKEFEFVSEGSTKVTITRTLERSAQNMEWRTQDLALGSRTIVSKGVVVKPEALAPPVSNKKGEAADQTPPKPAALPTDLPQKVLQSISQALLGRFQVIPSTRNRQTNPGTATQRQSILDDQTVTQVQTMAQLVQAGERRRKFNPLQRSLKSILPDVANLSAPQGQVFVLEDKLEVPLALTGGGVQETINVLLRIQSMVNAREGSAVGIEEPETHLHPDAMKLLLRYLNKDDSVSQFWLSTHSPFLVDRTELANVWLVTRKDGASEVMRLTDTTSLRTAFLDLGVRPSDVLYSDAVFLVEGDSDAEFYRGMALKMGFHEIEFTSLIPTGGFPKERHHLEMWSDIAGKTHLPVFILLDADAKKEVDSVVKDKLIDARRAYQLDGGSLEDAYPRDKLMKALQDEFGLSLKENDLPKTELAKFLEEKLHEKNLDKRGWKKRLARRMVDVTSVEEVPEALRRLLQSLRAEMTVSTVTP